MGINNLGHPVQLTNYFSSYIPTINTYSHIVASFELLMVIIRVIFPSGTLISTYIYISILIILTVSCNRHQINNNRNLSLRNDYGHAYYHPITDYSIPYHRPQ